MPVRARLRFGVWRASQQKSHQTISDGLWKKVPFFQANAPRILISEMNSWRVVPARGEILQVTCNNAKEAFQAYVAEVPLKRDQVCSVQLTGEEYIVGRVGIPAQKVEGLDPSQAMPGGPKCRALFRSDTTNVRLVAEGVGLNQLSSPFRPYCRTGDVKNQCNP